MKNLCLLIFTIALTATCTQLLAQDCPNNIIQFDDSYDLASPNPQNLLADQAFAGAELEDCGLITVGTAHEDCVVNGHNRVGVISLINRENPTAEPITFRSGVAPLPTGSVYSEYTDIKRIGDNSYVVVGSLSGKPGVFFLDVFEDKTNNLTVQVTLENPNVASGFEKGGGGAYGINTTCDGGYIVTCLSNPPNAPFGGPNPYLVRLTDNLSPLWVTESIFNMQSSKTAVEIPLAIPGVAATIGYALIGEFRSGKGVHLAIFEEPTETPNGELAITGTDFPQAEIDLINSSNGVCVNYNSGNCVIQRQAVYYNDNVYCVYDEVYKDMECIPYVDDIKSNGTKAKYIAVNADGTRLGIAGMHRSRDYLLITLPLPLTGLEDFTYDHYRVDDLAYANYAQSIIGHSNGDWILAGRSDYPNVQMSALRVQATDGVPGDVATSDWTFFDAPGLSTDENRWADYGHNVTQFIDGSIAVVGRANSEFCKDCTTPCVFPCDSGGPCNLRHNHISRSADTYVGTHTFELPGVDQFSDLPQGACSICENELVIGFTDQANENEGCIGVWVQGNADNMTYTWSTGVEDTNSLGYDKLCNLPAGLQDICVTIENPGRTHCSTICGSFRISYSQSDCAVGQTALPVGINLNNECLKTYWQGGSGNITPPTNVHYNFQWEWHDAQGSFIDSHEDLDVPHSPYSPLRCSLVNNATYCVTVTTVDDLHCGTKCKRVELPNAPPSGSVGTLDIGISASSSCVRTYLKNESALPTSNLDYAWAWTGGGEQQDRDVAFDTDNPHSPPVCDLVEGAEYCVTVTTTDGRQSDTACKTIALTIKESNGSDIIRNSLNLSSTINSESSSEVMIYPNPTTGLFNVMSLSPIETIEVFDILGQKQEVEYLKGDSAIQLNLVDAQSGVYLIRISNREQIILKQIQLVK